MIQAMLTQRRLKKQKEIFKDFVWNIFAYVWLNVYFDRQMNQLVQSDRTW